MRVAREAVGPDGQAVPQQWLAHTTASRSNDRRRLPRRSWIGGPLRRRHTRVTAVTHRPAETLSCCTRRSRLAGSPSADSEPPDGGTTRGARDQGRRTVDCRRAPVAPRPRPCPRPAMGQVLVGHAGSVSATRGHEHCPQVCLAAAAPHEPSSSRAGMIAGLCCCSRAEPLAATACGP